MDGDEKHSSQTRESHRIIRSNRNPVIEQMTDGLNDRANDPVFIDATGVLPLIFLSMTCVTYALFIVSFEEKQ